MFGTLGGPELFLILVIALIVFGPRKLPEIGQSMGRMLREFRKASTEFKRTVEDEVEADRLRPTPQIPAAHRCGPGSQGRNGGRAGSPGGGAGSERLQPAHAGPFRLTRSRWPSQSRRRRIECRFSNTSTSCASV